MNCQITNEQAEIIITPPSSFDDQQSPSLSTASHYDDEDAVISRKGEIDSNAASRSYIFGPGGGFFSRVASKRSKCHYVCLT